MKKHSLFSLIAGSIMILATPLALAESPTKPTKPTNATSSTTTVAPEVNHIKMSTVLQNLQDAGYVAVKEIDLGGAFYKAEAITMQGEEVDVRLDPETGKIIKPESKTVALSMLAAIKKVEEAGYHNIYKVESEDDKYEVKALDKDGRKANLKVDAFTGKVTKKWF